MSGAKIINALKEAIAGDLARVWIDGVCWAPEARWQPMETALENDKILVYLGDDAYGANPQIAVWNGRWESAWDGTPFDGEAWPRPSHWMPCPEPPEDRL